MIGVAEDQHRGVFEFQSGERVTALSIWGNAAGTRCGAFKIKTSKNREYFPQMYDWGLKQEYPMDVGSGFLCGLYGGAGSDIDKLGFAFLQPVKNSVLKNVSYPTLSSDLIGTTPVTIDRITIDNLSGTVPQESKLSGKESVIVSREWGTTTGLEASITTSVSAGIPEVGEASVEATLKVSQEFSFKRTETKEVERKVDHTVTCPAHQLLRATATTYIDKLDLPYTATLEVELETGAKFSYDVNGIYRGTTVRDIFLEFEVLDAAPEDNDNKGRG